MSYLLSIIKVEDYEKWKAEFDTGEGNVFRKSGGMRSYQLFRTEDDSNTLALLCEFDTLDAARKFVQSDELKEVSRQFGVIGESGSWIIDEIEKKTV